jgi:5-methylcytosine-specific restriction endonuclease McrA
MTRERIPIEPRRVSPGTRAKILAATDHVCARPGCPERATDVDHILPLWLGGSNREKNLEGLCPAHHAAKTKAEASLRAKAKRIEARENGTRRERKPIASSAGGWPKGRKIPTRSRLDRLTDKPEH